MSSGFDTKVESFNLVNNMLPRIYYPNLQDNIFEQVTSYMAKQLLGNDMTIDYDQFLSKKPGKTKAAFAMHEDMGYWPKDTPDTKTATFCLALTPSNKENGCLQFIPGSNKSKKIVKHKPIQLDPNKKNENREDAHALVLDDKDIKGEVVHVEVPRGSITVHD
ncbi:hypothetical protein fh0823_17720 [Francisella halioticida]|uniref:Uncharacterized protein n=1 Tax=Francisella halioticida TaxID=549298 RepID=A0ABM6M1D5_9GAMM|nr:phytanoyl-CoA dioxygenase family protein [Francisella halioticida]ASG68688.1 hypothetical protein CDV26_10100 [Francisella halioticida]BCD91633.1 hypothetical protein fh0823_17720 [Francisella halioticida]